jgi:enterochelin esterase family protein
MYRFLFILLLPASLFAQVSPDILPDGRVTFRIVAPQAEIVTVKGQWAKEPVQLAKKENGLWEGTTPDPVEPGIHEYNFSIDKLRTIDSRNRLIKPQRWPKSSLLHIPSKPPAHWDIQDIPQGTVHYHDYYAKTLGEWRKLVVYTPPAMDELEKPIPVMYLSHGHSDTQESWTVSGKAHWIMDSLIHNKLAQPMIIVMPDGHAVDPEGTDKVTYRPENTEAFGHELVADVIPFVESHYPAGREPSQRAFAGLSMGGGHAFTVAFKYHALFSFVGSFSARPLIDHRTAGKVEPGKMNQNMKLFWVACGDQDFLFENNQRAHAIMNELGIRHEYVVTPNDSHSWPVWRRYLVEFLPKLF